VKYSGATSNWRSRRSRSKCASVPLCWKSQFRYLNGCALVRWIAPVDAARMCAMKMRARICEQISLMFSFAQAGSAVLKSPGSARSMYQPSPKPSPFVARMLPSWRNENLELRLCSTSE